MNSDVTIHIFVGANGARMIQDAATVEASSPLPLEQLQVSAAGGSPVPLSPEELATVQTRLPTGSPPAPMAIEQLQTATLTTAPSPQPLGAFEGMGGPPQPRPLEELGAVEAPPQPLTLEQLGEPPNSSESPPPEKPSGGKRSSGTRQQK